MNRPAAVFALASLAAATLALAQQPAPQTPSQPPASSSQEQQGPTTSPSDASADPGTKADAQTLMRNCMTQVQAANPGVPEKDIRDYCDKQVKSYTSPQN